MTSVFIVKKKLVVKKISNKEHAKLTSMQRAKAELKHAFVKYFYHRADPYIVFLMSFRNLNNKENLAKTATSITESLLELNQTMDSQVKKGNLTMNTLGKHRS